MEVRYTLLRSNRAVIVGVGQTLNIGSGGVLFTTAERLPIGWTVELSVNWPARLDRTCPLQLVVEGHVIRSEDYWAAVTFKGYEFHTLRTP